MKLLFINNFVFAYGQFTDILSNIADLGPITMIEPVWKLTITIIKVSNVYKTQEQIIFNTSWYLT